MNIKKDTIMIINNTETQMEMKEWQIEGGNWYKTLVFNRAILNCEKTSHHQANAEGIGGMGDGGRLHLLSTLVHQANGASTQMPKFHQFVRPQWVVDGGCVWHVSHACGSISNQCGLHSAGVGQSPSETESSVWKKLHIALLFSGLRALNWP